MWEPCPSQKVLDVGRESQRMSVKQFGEDLSRRKVKKKNRKEKEAF